VLVAVTARFVRRVSLTLSLVPGGVDALPGPLTSGSVLLDGQGHHLLQVLRSEQGLFGPFKEPAFVVPSPGPLSFDPVGHANVPGGRWRSEVYHRKTGLK
jgi:hypothetical protein